MKTLELEKMRWPEIKQALEDGFKTVIIPAGSIEQHGPHLPECVDNIVGLEVAKKVAENLGKTLVAPIITPGLSLHHMTFPGTISLRPETFMALAEDYVDCYYKHGFRNMVFFSGHGGNFRALDEVARNARKKYDDLTIFNAINIKDMEIILPDLERIEGIPKGAIGMGHSCDYETSMMLDLCPALVEMNAVEVGNTCELTDETLETLYQGGMSALTANGILGDPTNATAERGARNIERIIYECQKKIEALVNL